MLALLWDGVAAQLVDRDPPEVRQGMAIVRVHVAGICRTDIEITKGYMGFRGVLGHEFVGSVVDGPADWRGHRVVGEINFACGTCLMCSRGLGRHCSARRVMGIQGADGAFAEFVAVPVTNLHRVGEGIADDVAVFVEPLAAACEVLEQVHVRASTECVVLGDGKLGLLVAQVLFQAGARVLAVGKHDHKLAILRRRGIETVNITQWNRAAADLVVEATGTPEGISAAVAAARPRGTVVLKTTAAAAAQLNLAPLVINEVTVVGSRCGSFPPALRALEAASVDVRSLITARRRLGEAMEALRAAATPGALKVLLEP